MNAPSRAADGLYSAVLLHQQGRLAEADALCRDILRAQPAHAGALHLLGVMTLQAGRAEAAVDLIRKSLAADSNQPFAHSNLAAALLSLKRPEEALACCDNALRLTPDCAQSHYNRGTALLELKRLAAALASFDRALLLKPDYVQALNNRGSVLARLNRHADALESYDRAMRLMSDSAETLNNRGNALEALGRHAEALDSYERALRIRPDFVEALNNRGGVLRVLNRFGEALESYDRALQLRPDFAETLNGRGRALQALRRPEEALACYERAVHLRPDFAEALNNCGSALWNLQRCQDALVSFDRALACNPQYAEALFNRSNVLRDLHRHQEALESCERALLVKPDFVAALNGRGNAQLALKRGVEALASYEMALQLRPDFPEALHNRGNALRSLRRLDEALASFERAIQLGENRPEALANYGWALLESHRYEAAAACFAKVVAVAPDYNYVLGAMCFARLSCCEWDEYQQTLDRIIAAVKADKHVIAPFPLMAISDDPEVNLRCARASVADRYPASLTPAWHGQRYEHDRIRVAYVSPDLRDHVVANLLAPLIERHDRERFETIAICVRPPEETPLGQRIRAAFDRFHDVSSMNDDQVAALMCDLQIDIAVDLGGLTGDQRPGILARRPAPVQVSYLGYPGSMGADYIHYLLADRNIIPAEYRGCYAEKVVYLPDGYQVNHSERPPARALTRADCGLPAEGFVFCCFNNSFKITPAVFDIWMRILGQVPGSVLWLAGHRPSVVRNLRAAAAKRGIAPERLIFAAHKANLDEHLVRYTQADLFLDTFPFNAHATASDALWYAVPVVTCVGRAFAGRVALSLLRTVGLPELITESPQDYEQRILELATTAALLADIRAKLAHNRTTSALFDTDRFRRHLESAYLTMRERHQRGEPPESFAVGVIS